MRATTAFLFLFLLSPGLAPSRAMADSAAPDYVVPKQAIQGAESSIPLGEMVDLTVSPVYEKIPYLEKSSYSWKILDGYKEKRVRQVDGGVFFGAGLVDKTLYAMCVATHLYVVKDDKGAVTRVASRTVVLTAQVVIGKGSNPDPPPVPPPPPPPPEPDFPDGEFKLAKFAYRAAVVGVTDAKARSAGAKALAKSFEGMASAIAAGALKEPKAILEETAKSNKKALTEAAVPTTAWDGFLTSLQDYLYELYKGGKLKTAGDYQKAFGEIAQGLGKVGG